MQVRGFVLVWVAIAGCTKVGIAPNYTIHGSVVSEQGKALAFARIEAQATFDASTAADANGFFELRGVAADNLAVRVRASGYATRTCFLAVKPDTVNIDLAVTLRPIDRAVHVALPTTTVDTISFSVVSGEGQGTLTLLPDSLVTVEGGPAVGNANISLTYWHPFDDLHAAPGDLLTANPKGGQPRRLQTFGLMAIEIEQGGRLLQVAPGKTLPLSFQIPMELQQFLHVPGLASPELFYLNELSGLWEHQGSITEGNLTLASDASSITAQLSHLGAWSIGGPRRTSLEPLFGVSQDDATGASP